MRIEEENKYPENPLTPVLGFVEAENLVESLQKFTLEDIGTSKFLDQHQTCEKLNLQAHQSAMANTEEFVLESFLTFEKIEVLIHNLIVMETWKEFVFPLLVEPLATKNSMRLYFVLYHEATLINLLEILIYHKHVVAESGDTLIDLIDYVARKLVRLCSAQDVRSIEAFETGKMENTQNASSTSAQVLEKVAAMATRSPAEELIHHSHSIEFRICMSACGIARLLCEHAETMSLSGLSRITGTHDYLLLFLPLIENPPWTRRTASGKWEKLIDFKWQSVLPINLLRLTKLEAQPWLAVFSLLAKKQFRERYHLNAFRKSQLMRVRKYINETLVDQLPVLADVQRYLDELSLMEVSEPNSLSSAGGLLLFQSVAPVRESLLQSARSSTSADTHWHSLATQAALNVFFMTDATDADLVKLAEIYSEESAEAVFD